MAVIKTCPTCSNGFAVRHGQGGQEPHEGGIMRGDRIKALCKVCGRPFETPYALAEICDWVCRSEHMSRKAAGKKGLPPRDTVRQECEWCGDDYFGVQGQARCSEACREEM